MTIKSLDIDTTKPTDNVKPDKSEHRAMRTEIKTKYETLAGQALRYRAAWSGATAYLSGDVVTHISGWWHANVDNTNKTPGTDSEWDSITAPILDNDTGDAVNDWQAWASESAKAYIDARAAELNDALGAISATVSIGKTVVAVASVSGAAALTRGHLSTVQIGTSVVEQVAVIANTEDSAVAATITVLADEGDDDEPGAGDQFSFLVPAGQTGLLTLVGPDHDIVQEGTPSGVDGVVDLSVSTAWMAAGYAVSGAGVPAGAVIESVDSATQITVDQTTTASDPTDITVTVPWALFDGAPSFRAPSPALSGDGVVFGMVARRVVIGEPAQWVTSERPLELAYAPAEVVDPANVSGAVDIDLSSGGDKVLTMTGDVTSSAFVNRPMDGYSVFVVIDWVQDGTGGHSITHPAGTRWPAGSAPTFIDTPGAVNTVSYRVRGTAGAIDGFDGGMGRA